MNMRFLNSGYTEKFTSSQQRMWNILVFLSRLLILSIPLYVLLSFTSVLFPIQVMVASQTGWILSFLGYSVSQSTGLVSLTGPSRPFSFWIDADCTAWKSVLFAFALFFAIPKVDNRKRVIGLTFAIPVIWVVNLSRIVGSVLIEQSHGLETAMFVHDILWQFGLISLVLGVWIIWFKFYTSKM